MADDTNDSSYPMPGPAVFSAAQEMAMRQARRIAPAPTPYKRDQYMAQQDRYRIGPDDATDDQ